MVEILRLPNASDAARAWLLGLFTGLVCWMAGPRADARAEGPAREVAVLTLPEDGYGLPARPPRLMFGFLAVQTGLPDDIRQMRAFRARYAREEAAVRRCLADPTACPTAVARQWSGLVAEMRGRPLRQMLPDLNRRLNALRRHLSDADVWGQSDYWATPFEFLTRHGDCEDFTLLKYVSLAALGVPEDAMRVVVAMDRPRGIPHAFLAVMVEGEALILDTSFDEVRADHRIDAYHPHYAFNFHTRWGFVAPIVRPTLVAANDDTRIARAGAP